MGNIFHLAQSLRCQEKNKTNRRWVYCCFAKSVNMLSHAVVNSLQQAFETHGHIYSGRRLLMSLDKQGSSGPSFPRSKHCSFIKAPKHI